MVQRLDTDRSDVGRQAGSDRDVDDEAEEGRIGGWYPRIVVRDTGPCEYPARRLWHTGKLERRTSGSDIAAGDRYAHSWRSLHTLRRDETADDRPGDQIGPIRKPT